MKKILFLFLVSIGILSANAQNSFVYGYCNDNIEGLSYSSSSTTLRIAFVIPQETAASYAGFEVTKIHVGFGNAASATKVFIIENMSTAATPAYTQNATFAANAWSEITLTTPYVITGDKSVMIGYEYTSATYSIGFDASDDANEYSNFYSVKSGSNYGAWLNLSQYGFQNVTIRATIASANPLPEGNDLSIISSTPLPLDIHAGGATTVETEVLNTTPFPLSSFDINYSFNDGTVITETKNATIAPLTKYTFSKSFTFDNEGTYQLKAFVSNIGGNATAVTPENDSLVHPFLIYVGEGLPQLPRPRKALLEEYTGIHCQYCPDGHRIANETAEKYPDQFFVINIHQGGYATPGPGEPDFRTAFGNALANQTGLTGYPAGTVNRSKFFGNSSTAIDRGSFEAAAKESFKQVSPVNIQITSATVDFATRTLTVIVDGVYTGATTASNKLNVALLQENVLGPQTGGSTWYPEMMVGNLYRHNHILRHLLTGQWGEAVETTIGSTFHKEYVYILPTNINQVPLYMDELTVVAFVAEGNTNIFTAAKAEVETILATTPLTSVYKVEKTNAVPDNNSQNKVGVRAIVQNLSTENVTSYTVKITSDIDEQIVTVTGKNIQPYPYGFDTVVFPVIEYSYNTDVDITAAVTICEGENITTLASFSFTIRKDYNEVELATPAVVLNLWQDRYGTETTWKLYDALNTVVASGGPYSNLSANGTLLHTHNITVPTNGTCRFELNDSYGDGINSDYGAGHYEFRDSEGNLIVSDNGIFTTKDIRFFEFSLISGVQDEIILSSKVYPTISSGQVFVETEKPASIQVVDVLGKIHYGQLNASGTTVLNLDLQNGTYFIIVNDGSKTVHKIVMQR